MDTTFSHNETFSYFDTIAVSQQDVVFVFSENVFNFLPCSEVISRAYFNKVSGGIQGGTSGF